MMKKEFTVINGKVFKSSAYYILQRLLIATKIYCEGKIIMPHILIKMYPGRTDEQKKVCTEKVIQACVDALNCDESHFSMAFEEVPKDEWPEKVYRPEILEKLDTLTKKPEYNPFK